MKRVCIRLGDEILGTAEVAESLWTRSWGLLGRRGLPAKQGLWIRPCGSVHTWFMRFPIDLVYLNRDCDVVKTSRAVPAFRFSFGGRRAHSVIELPAGFLDGSPVSPGVRLEMTPGLPQVNP